MQNGSQADPTTPERLQHMAKRACQRACLGLLAAGMLSACDSTPKPAQPRAQTPSSPPERASDLAHVFPQRMDICAGMHVSNQPEYAYSQLALVRGRVVLALAPVQAACLSSGFGMRGGRRHKGYDLHHAKAVDIYAAGSGVVVESHSRKDYGKMIVIDHGHGVYTRYGHIEWVKPRMVPGAPVEIGTPIGSMGSTGSTRARNLHYEVLVGDYNTPKGSFGLTPIDIYAQPRIE